MDLKMKDLHTKHLSMIIDDTNKDKLNVIIEQILQDSDEIKKVLIM